jgi:hypothetical protein
MHVMNDNTYVIEHMARGQWEALERERQIKFWAETDVVGRNRFTYEIGIEQEPGSGGKAWARFERVRLVPT